MTSPIDPIRRAAQTRRAQRSDADPVDGEDEAERVNLPAIYDGPVSAPPPQPRLDGGAAFAAHLMGQGGEKRGLRGGPPVLDAAKSVYSRTEYSGPHDRRARKGGVTKTEI